MKVTKVLMGMPITVEVIDSNVSKKDIEEIFKFFKYVDQTFSTYKENSEISKFNKGKLSKKDFSQDMKLIFKLAEETRKETEGYFNIFQGSKCDPSGIVKGWATIINQGKRFRQPNAAMLTQKQPVGSEVELIQERGAGALVVECLKQDLIVIKPHAIARPGTM